MFSRGEKRVPAEDLTEALLREHPVWEFCNDDEAGETVVRPVKKLPIESADGRLIACEFMLADGTKAFGEVATLSLQAEEQNQHFLGISVFIDGELVHLARYHDAWYESHGPAMLAAKLKKKEEEVFPISYDVSGVAVGNPKCLKGVIARHPKARLSRSEIIRLAVG